MSDTLRDQLMGLGFKPAPTPARERKPASQQRPHKGGPAVASASPGAAEPIATGAPSGTGGITARIWCPTGCSRSPRCPTSS